MPSTLGRDLKAQTRRDITEAFRATRVEQGVSGEQLAREVQEFKKRITVRVKEEKDEDE